MCRCLGLQFWEVVGGPLFKGYYILIVVDEQILLYVKDNGQAEVRLSPHNLLAGTFDKLRNISNTSEPW
jgi:hypothetical protein